MKNFLSVEKSWSELFHFFKLFSTKKWNRRENEITIPFYISFNAVEAIVIPLNTLPWLTTTGKKLQKKCFESFNLKSMFFYCFYLTSCGRNLANNFSFSYFSFTLRDQTVRWIGAHFCVCMFLDCRDKSLNMLKFCRNNQRGRKNKKSVFVAESIYNSQNAQFGLGI